MRFNFKSLVLYGALGVNSLGFAHEGKNHVGRRSEETKVSDSDALAESKRVYQQTIEPIFKKSCMDCHGQASSLPWYHSVPLVKAIIDDDMREAKKHIDMSKSFPFDGHGSLADDLLAIEKSVKNGTMPPFRFRVMHPGSKLSDQDLKSVLDWTSGALQSGQVVK